MAATRSLTVMAPAEVKPGTPVRVTVAAGTDHADSEHVGFLHAESSADGGRTWQPAFYFEKPGRAISRAVELKAGAEGTKLLVRARVAFRGGKAGDVDFTGAPIAWDGSWGKWQSPPARQVTIVVTGR
jgi:hypothetical protein